MRLFVFLAAVTLTACTDRPLTANETAFARTIMGDELNAEEVRITRGSVLALARITVPPRPQTTCREKLYPELTEPVEGVIPAFVYGDRMYYGRDFWERDFLAGYPTRMDLVSAMRLAHELTHVWQWQARAQTNYHPLKAAREHQLVEDPYLFDTDEVRPFLSYGFEQQGALVEEYVCCRAVDPDGARTNRLRQIVSQVFPAAAKDEAVPQSGIRIPWAGADLKGVCS
ncbi:MAG: hypothetical protein AAGA87_17990 [Pseudomonadota bacterium]